MTPVAARAGRIDAFLCIAERSIGLLDRCRPFGWAAAFAEFLQAHRRGCARAPTLDYGPPPNLGDLRGALESIADGLAGRGALAALYAARAHELALEAELAEHVGAPGFRRLAGLRFLPGTRAVGRRAITVATEWARLQPSDSPEPRFFADDTSTPHSLVSIVRREIGRWRLPARVVPRSDLASVAAVGDGVVFVRSGCSLTRRTAERIALHEVQGHLVPRVEGSRSGLALAGCGSHGATDDEEGRALLLERRAGRLDDARCAELGRRHLLAVSVRRGATLVDSVSEAMALGASREEAVREAFRVHRGGGLAREIVYLPALLRVERALERDASLERWLSTGRRGVDAARVLAAHEGSSLGSERPQTSAS